MRDHFAAFRKPREASAHQAAEAATSSYDPDDVEERAAMAIDGGFPASYVDAFARIQVVHPIRRSRAELARMVDDAGWFVDAWGEVAAGLARSAEDPFGAGGRVAALKGAAVTALASDTAGLSNGSMHRRHI